MPDGEWNQASAGAVVGGMQSTPSLNVLAQRAGNHFERRFGRTPRWLVAAPGRVNLIGEHTDYNDGFVLPMAIDRYVVLAADRAPGDNPRVDLFSAALNQQQTWRPTDCQKGGLKSWSRYVAGVLCLVWERNLRFGALDVLIASNLPLAGGLSSSAALEVATATLAETVSGLTLDPVDKALLCQQAEHDYAGVPCGIMDQFAVVFGQTDHLLLLDCRSGETKRVPLTDPEIQVLIINTNVPRQLRGGEYAARRSQCAVAAKRLGVASLRDARWDHLQEQDGALTQLLCQRVRHVISENERTVRAAERMAASDWAEVGALMYQSHASLREDFHVSCPELDLLVDLLQQQGRQEGSVIGARMTGGGFGGCVVALVRQTGLARLGRQIRQQYYEQTGLRPSLFTTRPARGAHVLRSELPGIRE